MKKIIFQFVMMAMAFTSMAQPTTITWQGKLLDASGNAITQNNVSMNFAMFDASSGGNQLWPASGVVTKTVNVVNGLYSLQLGSGSGDDIAFTAAMFNGKTPWLEVKVGTEILPRMEITNVPFALISNDLSAAGWENPGEIGKTTPNTGKFTSVETGNLKVINGASAGNVLTSDAAGNASWTTPYTGLTNFTESNFTYDSRIGVKFTPNNAADDVDLVLQPKRYSALIAQQPDGTNAGGNKRGALATDFQRFRTNASQVASGGFATIVGGASNTASGTNSTAMGNGARATGINSVAMGSGVTASGHTSIAMGNETTASGRFSTAMGYQTYALSGFETVIGRNSTMYTPLSDWNWEPADRLFVVGNGNDDELSNALTILKNANTTIGGSLTVNGNGTNTSITWPSGRGSSGLVLKTAGDGSTSWGNAVEPGTAPGQMQYWNGTAWVTVAAGKGGQTMIFTNGSPLWVYEYDIINHLSVGDYYKGGIIAYFFQSGDPGYDANVRHGFIAAPLDQSTGSTWGCNGTSISGADGIALGTGQQNTLDIMNGCSEAGIAAKICYDLVLNGYSDWFLPSKNELNLLYVNKSAIGGFASAWYWSSSENSSVRAWTQYFDTGYQMGDFKNWATYVRAIRTF